MPNSAAARLRTRLRNHKVFIHTDDAGGWKVDEGEAGGKLELESCKEMWLSVWLVTLVLSGWSHLYDSIVKAVSTEENRPAYTLVQTWE